MDKGKLRSFLAPIASIFFGLAVGAVFLLITGKNPIDTYFWMFYGAWGSPKFVAEMLTRSTPLILTGLALAVGFKAGVFNIGAEGQLLFGGIVSAYIGAYWHLPIFLHPVIAIIAGSLAGASLGFIPGWLKVKKGLNEVVITILMNYLAIYFTNYLVRGPLKYGYLPRTKPILDTAKLPIIVNGTRLHLGFILALITVFVLYFILEKTVWGYSRKAVGFNPHASRYGGIDVNKVTVFSMLLSGGLAGMAGSIEILGLHHRFYGQFSPGYGFDGIMVALIGRNNPIGVVFAAILLATIRTGSGLVQLRAGVSKEIVWVIQALIILFVAVSYIYERFFRFGKINLQKGEG